MVDTLKLKRTIKDEFCSRFYTLSGAEFNTMKDIVKTAGGKFQSLDKTWLVTGDVLKIVSASGLTVTEESPFRFRFVEGGIRDLNDVSTVDIFFDYLSTDIWKTVPFEKRISFDTSAEVVEAECKRITDSAIAITGKEMSIYPRYYGVRALARTAVETEGQHIITEMTNILDGRRTKEAMKKALDTLKEMCA